MAHSLYQHSLVFVWKVSTIGTIREYCLFSVFLILVKLIVLIMSKSGSGRPVEFHVKHVTVNATFGTSCELYCLL